MRKRNWREYNKALVQRGSLTFLIDPKVLKTIAPRKEKRRGRPLAFSNHLIQILLMIKIHYRLTYRTLEGFSRFFLERIAGKLCRMPTYSLTCKRAKALSLHLPKLSSARPATVLVDATGIKIHGEGEWKVKVHGKGRPRKWIKIHVALDAKTQEIVAEQLTDPCFSDGEILPSLLDQVPRGVKTVIGDGGYDGEPARSAIKEKGARALVPPPKNAVYRGDGGERDRAILDIRIFGGDLMAKSIWGKLSGYSRRALVETTFSRHKRMFGDRFFSKTFDRQLVENRLKCIILNKMMKNKC